MSEIKKENITISCADSYELAATLFTPAEAPKAAVMFGPATGIKRGFYAGLATHLTEQGYAAVTFDNRGIGDSLYGRLKDSKASLQKWGELDMPAVLEELKARLPGTTYHLIGHSAGGQLVGLMHNAKDLSSMFNFASSSGRLKLMTFPYIVKARFFMNVYMPLSNLVLGYAKNDIMGMGENLPKNVAKEWTDYCSGQGYVKTVFGSKVKTHLYDELDFASKWVLASDDEIATEATLDDMLSVFKKLPAEKHILVPSELGKKEIGHMKFFSSRNKDLWPLLTEWLERSISDAV